MTILLTILSLSFLVLHVLILLSLAANLADGREKNATTKVLLSFVCLLAGMLLVFATEMTRIQ